MKLTICVLLYGNFPNLAERCLHSLGRLGCWLPQEVVDIRVGVHNVSAETEAVLTDWAAEQRHFCPVLVYSPTNTDYFKYPTMRRMFSWPQLAADYVMWLDDDTYVDEPGFFACALTSILQQQSPPAQIGQIWRMSKTVGQKKWIQAQNWHSNRKPELKQFRFCTGGFWLARTDVLQKLDYPFKELKHCGGDIMLSEAVYQLGEDVVHFDTGIRINADKSGRHSKAARRGYTEPPLATSYCGKPLSTAHQLFDTNVTIRSQDGEQRWIICQDQLKTATKVA